MATKCWSLLVVVLVASASLACSGDDEPATPTTDALDRLTAASSVTREAGTARVDQTIRMAFPEGGPTSAGTVEVVATGFVDMRARRGRMSVTTTGSGMAGADALGGDME